MSEGAVRRITWRTADVARFLSLALLFLFAWKFFWMVVKALFLGMIAVLVAIVLYVPAKALSRWIPFRVAFALILFLFLAGNIGLLIALVPQILHQVQLLATQLPPALAEISTWLEQRTGGERGDGVIAERLGSEMADFVGRFVPLAFNLISVLLGSFAILILAVFLAIQPQVYRDLFLRMVPDASRERWARAYDEVGRNLRNWVIGKAVTMLAVGVITWIGLTLFEIPAALALAALAAVMEFIPNFGPTIAAAPAIVAAFLISPLTALYVALFYFVLQQVQSAITVPLVEQRAVAIPPAVLLIWQLMLAIGFGLLALFVATPLLAVIVVTVRILYYEPAAELSSWDRRDQAGAPDAPVAAGDPDDEGGALDPREGPPPHRGGGADAIPPGDVVRPGGSAPPRDSTRPGGSTPAG